MTKAVVFPFVSSQDGVSFSDLAYFSQPTKHSVVLGEANAESSPSPFDSLPNWMVHSIADPKVMQRTRLAKTSSVSAATTSPNSPTLAPMNSTESSSNTASPSLFPPPPGLVLRRLPDRDVSESVNMTTATTTTMTNYTSDRQPMKPGRVASEQSSKSRSGQAAAPAPQFPSAENGQMSQGELLLAACYKTQMCRYFLKGSCRSGKECRFAHTPEELHVRSNLRRTSLCVRWQAGVCRAGQSCRFAHGHWELGPIEASARRNSSSRSDSSENTSNASRNEALEGKPFVTMSSNVEGDATTCTSTKFPTSQSTFTLTTTCVRQLPSGVSWVAKDISGSPTFFENMEDGCPFSY